MHSKSLPQRPATPALILLAALGLATLGRMASSAVAMPPAGTTADADGWAQATSPVATAAPRMTMSTRTLMAIPPPEAPDSFQALSRLRERWQDKTGRRLKVSMGMSGDLEEAIRAGSDQVRIGTAFFGSR